MAAIVGSREGHLGNPPRCFTPQESREPLELTHRSPVPLVTAWLSLHFTLASLPPAPLPPGVL